MRPLVLFLLAFPSLLLAETLGGKVEAVLDGDTIQVAVTEKGRKRSLKVRLEGIDAPEKGQPHYEKSRQWLSARLLGKNVTLEKTSTDRYGVPLAKVLLNGTNVGIGSVRAGMAWWAIHVSPKDEALKKAEMEARKAKRGLWGEARVVPPWKFRDDGPRPVGMAPPRGL